MTVASDEVTLLMADVFNKTQFSVSSVYALL